MPAATERKLAAIMIADVVGFSGLMERDESRTFSRLRHLRGEVTFPKVEAHGGRVIKTTGDGFLAEFNSATAALRCAVEIQRSVIELEAGQLESDRIHFRIGLNVGDIIIDGTDVAGDGVNIAARLESLSPVDGICVSSLVREQIRDDLGIAFEDLGDQALKNISRSIRAYAVRLGSAILQQSTVSAEKNTVPKHWGGIGEIDLSLPDKPSIAVLPFANLSGDPEQEYFADGIVDDIISALSRVRAFFVIARNSSFTYKGRAVNIKQVGHELGVRYVLEGSIRKAGNRVRIVGQLVESENGRHIWADRFEGNLDNIFELQDRITESVVGAIEPNLRLAEIERARAKPTTNLHAYDLCLRAMPNLFAVSTKVANDEALDLLYRAIELDPGYSLAKAMCAWAYVFRKAQFWATEAEVQEGLKLAEEALADHRDDPDTLGCAAMSLSYLGLRHETALRAIERALAINPNSTRAMRAAGWIHTYLGDATVAIEHFQRAMRLNPVEPDMSNVLCGIGFAYFMAGRYEDALTAGQKSVEEFKGFTVAHRLVVLCLVQLGRLDEARVAANRIRELWPETTIAAIKLQVVYKDQVFRERYLNALRVAGIPE